MQIRAGHGSGDVIYTRIGVFIYRKPRRDGSECQIAKGAEPFGSTPLRTPPLPRTVVRVSVVEKLLQLLKLVAQSGVVVQNALDLSDCVDHGRVVAVPEPAADLRK